MWSVNLYDRSMNFVATIEIPLLPFPDQQAVLFVKDICYMWCGENKYKECTLTVQ